MNTTQPQTKWKMPQVSVFDDVVFQGTEQQALMVRPNLQVARYNLTNMAVQQIAPQAHALGFPIRFLGVARIPDKPILIKGEPNDWLIIDAEKNPLYLSRDIPIPTEHWDYLQAMARCGINFPIIFEAHEMFPEDGQIIEAEGRIPIRAVSLPQVDFSMIRRGLDKTIEQTRTGIERATPVIRKAAPVVAKILITAAIGAVTVGTMLAMTAMSAAASLDPMVIGVWPDPDGSGLAAFFLLSAWTW